MKTLLQIFTWWNGSTIGTRFHTWRFGKRVGEDQFGNVYYEGGRDSEGRTRRWVSYNGYAEASAIPPAGTAGCITAPIFLRRMKTTWRANGNRLIAATRPGRRKPIVRSDPWRAPASARA